MDCNNLMEKNICWWYGLYDNSEICIKITHNYRAFHQEIAQKEVTWPGKAMKSHSSNYEVLQL